MNAPFADHYGADPRVDDLPPFTATKETPPPLDDAVPPEFSDDALALAFTARHGGELRFTAGWGRWHRWDGTRWAEDDTLRVFDDARAICRSAAAQAANGNSRAAERIALAVGSARTVAAVEKMARADRRHAALPDQWDSDPWVLNTPGGVVDLRTGKLLPHDAARYLTKGTAVAPENREPTAFLKFLRRAMDGDEELIAFVQRMSGYALTGSTREHALFFAYGHGGAGKGVLINLLTAMLADYACTAPMSTFTASAGEQHPADLAMLRGARLVTAQETEEGRPWAEAKIKTLTGGDPISARLMRQNFFTFTPTFKLLFAGNRRPGLRGVDEAMRRRFNLIPFEVTVPREERDPELPEKLRGEWGAVLAWAIRGCLEWQRIGLAPPQKVRAATDAYLDDQDNLSAWIASCCEEAGTAEETSAALFGTWKKWAVGNGEEPGSNKTFSETLERHGYPKRKGMRGALFRGLRLRRPDYTDDPRLGEGA